MELWEVVFAMSGYFIAVLVAIWLGVGIGERRELKRRQPIRAAAIDNSPAARASHLLNRPKEQLTVRPLVPADLGKDSWTWRENEHVIIPAHTLLVLKGIDAGKWAAVKVCAHPYPGTVIGLLTSWDDTANVFIGPSESFYIHQLLIDGETTEHFALRGEVYEPNGATILKT